jgi:glyoxylase-like metal-dependent hydrolase (beta-lactamase superfamily II)
MKNHLFSGDTLLINGTGRTDFQNGNAKDSYNSIFNKLLKLPEETLLYPAHDYKGEKVSTIGKEKKQNPRLQVNSVDEYIDIMNNLELKKPTELETNVARNIKLGIDI